MNDSNSLSHKNWNCRYQIAFVPSYFIRRRNRRDIKEIV